MNTFRSTELHVSRNSDLMVLSRKKLQKAKGEQAGSVAGVLSCSHCDVAYLTSVTWPV